ncbi:glycerate dehydrogenase [Colletotrichum orchidophilum]|uniref:Glycerate dehydrogenase n=1 Tax=Colletotrichum orchidophilum TaxID=1209926 RepID=A0A1G4B4Y1_9PEZI|nr:glycerate dehydrogenase [Colletotrichum orchidophilum]OHE96498.1 glycerate dehydrogenase [Colletotrichum orchidophilum]
MAQPITPSHGHHHVIVLLEKLFLSTPIFNLPVPHTYELREYERTSTDQLAYRIGDADIIIRTVVPIQAEALSETVSPKLKLVAVVGSGTDSVDLDACRTRRIMVANTPHCNTSAVAEHAIGMYFAARRSITRCHRLTQAGEWAKRRILFNLLYGADGRAPRTCKDEVVGVLGYGGVGRKVATIAEALGMKVLLAGRKGLPETEGRVPFDEVISTASVIVLCLPKTESTIDYISTPELNSMGCHTVLINESRGGIVHEEALVKALEKGIIAGAATDVFVKEPAGEKDSPLLSHRVQDLNLTTTPHVAWVAEETSSNYLEMLKTNIAGFVAGNPVNLVT